MTRILLTGLAFVVVVAMSVLVNRWRYGTGGTEEEDKTFEEDWKKAGLPDS